MIAALMGLVLAASTTMPDGVVYSSTPASVPHMRWLVGHWRYPKSKLDAKDLKATSVDDWITVRVAGPGKLEVQFVPGDPKSAYNFAVTEHGGRLYAHIDICALLGSFADPDRCRFEGKPCQYPFLLERNADGEVVLRPINRVATHAANPWLRSAPLPTEYLDDDRCDGALFGMSDIDQRRFVFVAESPQYEQRYRRMQSKRRTP